MVLVVSLQLLLKKQHYQIMAKSSKGFEKFMNQEPKGAKKKELFRQEKRKAKAEARAAGEAFRQAKWNKDRGITTEKAEKPTTGKERVKLQQQAYEEAMAFKQTGKPVAKPAKESYPKKREGFSANNNQRERYSKDSSKTAKPAFVKSTDALPTQMPLNKYIAHAGICGRREAAEMVKQGLVKVNGDIVYEPGYKVTATDNVSLKDKKLSLQKNLVYILLNKPKDFITTSNDPQGRKTVLDLVKKATNERVYPVGRLDRNTTGVLLLTNDGELAQKLTHPSYGVQKIYEAKLDKPLTKKDFDQILQGVHLEDGLITPDKLAYADSKDKSVIGIEIHSGRNRIVRRIFESLGYDVKNLDRVLFANLSKKNVERGNWRMLTESEVRQLKNMKLKAVSANSTTASTKQTTTASAQ